MLSRVVKREPKQLLLFLMNCRSLENQCCCCNQSTYSPILDIRCMFDFNSFTLCATRDNHSKTSSPVGQSVVQCVSI